jgi:hypothetical protein
VVPCGKCGRQWRVPAVPGAEYPCQECGGRIVVPAPPGPAGTTRRKRLLLGGVGIPLILGVLGGVAALFALGILDYEEFRGRAAQAWKPVGQWLGSMAAEVRTAKQPVRADAAIRWKVQPPRNDEPYLAEPLVERLKVETELGPLEIPVADVRWIVPGLHTPTALRRRIAVLIDALGGDSDKARQAAEELQQLGRDTVAQLQKAEKERELKTASAATDVLSRIRSKHAEELAAEDSLATRYFCVRGRIAEESILMRTDQNTETVAWADVLRADREETSEIEWAERKQLARPTGTVLIKTDSVDWSGTLQTAAINLQTPYGTLEIPGNEIVLIERIDEELLRSAERATLDLLRAEDPEARNAALARLGELGSVGVLTLERVVQSDDVELSEEARRLLAASAAKGECYAPLRFRVDTVHGELGGTLIDESLEVRCEWGDLQKIPVASLRRLETIEKERL